MMSFSKFARNFVAIGGGCVGHGSTSKGNQTLWQHGNWEHHEVLVLIKCKHFEHVTQNCRWTLEHTWCDSAKEYNCRKFASVHSHVGSQEWEDV
jgi:hypothetical protein